LQRRRSASSSPSTCTNFARLLLLLLWLILGRINNERYLQWFCCISALIDTSPDNNTISSMSVRFYSLVLLTWSCSKLHWSAHLWAILAASSSHTCAEYTKKPMYSLNTRKINSIKMWRMRDAQAWSCWQQQAVRLASLWQWSSSWRCARR
jgi:hypothetical protein